MLRQAIAEDPANPALYYNLGNLYAEAGRQARGDEAVSDAHPERVSHRMAVFPAGPSVSAAGEEDEAIPFFEAAAQFNPSDYESLENLAVAYRETGRIADAERVLTRS